MAESLLPCPFCGGEAAYEEVEDRASSNSEAIRFSVGCGNEDCIGCQSMTSFSRRIDAITAWNRRAGVETSTVYGADHPDDQGVELAEKPGRSSRVPGAAKAVEPDGSALSTHFDIFGAVYRHALEIVHLTETVPAACFPVETAASPDIEQAFEAGWRVASRWAERYDLLADIGSAAYHADLTKALKSVSRLAVKASEVPK